MTRPGRYPQELRERAIRLVREHRQEHGSEWAAISSIAAKLGVILVARCAAERLMRKLGLRGVVWGKSV